MNAINHSIKTSSARVRIYNEFGDLYFLNNNHVVLQLDDEEPQALPITTYHDLITSGELVHLSGRMDEVVHLNLTVTEKAKAKRKKVYIDALLGEDSPGSDIVRKSIITKVAAQLKDPNPPGSTTLYNWCKVYKESGLGHESLFGRREKGSRGSYYEGPIQDLALEILDDCYLVRQGLNLSACYKQKFVPRFKQEMTLKNPEFLGKKCPSFSTFYEWARTMLDDVKVVEAREGKRAARAYKRQAMKRFVVDNILDRVEIDAAIFNIAVRDKNGIPMGPLCTYVAIDCRSRAIMGYHLQVGSGENSSGFLHCLYNSFMPKESPYLESTRNSWPVYGKPCTLVTDAGRALLSESTQTFIQHSKVTHVVAETGQGWKKPFIERWFGTCRTQFLSQLPGYVGKRTDRKQEVIDMKREACLTLNEFEQLFLTYIVDQYHQQPHTGLAGRTPHDVWTESIKFMPPEVPQRFEELKKIRGQAKERSIQREGVVINNVWYNSAELHAKILKVGGYRAGFKLVCHYDTEDLGAITVLLPNDEAIDVPARDFDIMSGMRLAELKSHKRFAMDMREAEGNFVPIHDNELMQAIRKRITSKKNADRKKLSGKPKADMNKVNERIVNDNAILESKRKVEQGSSSDFEFYDDLDVSGGFDID